MAFLPENHALAIAMMSYNGALDYGLLGDYDAMPDIDVVADGIRASLGELLAAAPGPPIARRRAGRPPPTAAERSRAEANGGPIRSSPPAPAGEAWPRGRHACQTRAGLPSPRATTGGLSTMDDDNGLIQPGEIAFHLDLTAAELKIVHTAAELDGRRPRT